MFDPRLSSSADQYCPCSIIVFREHLNVSGRCDDELRNTTRTRLRGVAEAGQYISVAFVAVTCRETVSVIEEVARKSADSMGVMMLNNQQSTGHAVQDTSSAWGKVFVEVGAMESMNIFMIKGMRGKESRASLDVTLNRLVNLQFLEISNTDWREPIPTTVSRLTQISDLVVTGNSRLVRLPKGLLDQLGALTDLKLSRNRLTVLQKLDKNTALESLYLETNQLTALPSLDNNIALMDLYVGGNQLTTLSLPNNVALRILGASRNNLTALSLEQNTALKFVSVANNKNLDIIPSWVLQLPKLEYLDCSGNNITTLTNDNEFRSNAVDSDALGRNTSLLLLGGNPVCGTMSSGNREDTGLMWGGRWNVQCWSQCSSTCGVSIPWNTIHSWLGDGYCSAGCNSTACGYDGGDCLQEL